MIEAPRRQTRSRLQPEARKAQILDAAAALVARQGLLPLQLDALGREIGVSKALIYSYFPTQYDLLNAILRRHLEAFAADLATVRATSAPADLLINTSCVYLGHVAAHGPLLHVLLTDLYMAGKIDPDLVAAAMRIFRCLARCLRLEAGLPADESVAALNLLMAIPEEAGAQVHGGRLDLATGRELCLELMAGGIEYLRAAQNDPRPEPPTP